MLHSAAWVTACEPNKQGRCYGEKLRRKQVDDMELHFLIVSKFHTQQCPNLEVACNQGCGARFPPALREQHASECSKRLTSCSYCALSVPMDTLDVGGVCVCVCVCAWLWCTVPLVPLERFSISKVQLCMPMGFLLLLDWHALLCMAYNL